MRLNPVDTSLVGRRGMGAGILLPWGHLEAVNKGGWMGSESPDEVRAASELRYRWVMLAALWLVYASFGLVSSSMAPLLGAIGQDLGLGRSALGSILGAWPLVYVATAIPAGALIDRFGLRRALAAGIFVIALSGLLRAVAVNYASMFVAVAIFGVGGPLISIGAPKLISTWFSKKDRGMALGIYITGPSVGAVTALATANSVLMPLTGSSWRLTLVVFAAMALLAGVVWSLVARSPEQVGARAPDAATGAETGLRAFSVLLSIRVVQLVLIMSIGSFLFSHGFNNWLPEILRASGLTATKAGFFAAVPTLVSIAGALTVGRLATPRRRIPLLIGLYLAGGVAALLIGVATGPLLIAGLVLQGAVRSGTMPVTMLVLMDAPQVGSRNMGAAGGLYFTAGEVGGVLGPLLIGIVADLSGGFLGGMFMLTGLSVMLAVLSLVLALAIRGARAPVGAAVPS